jgi:hypothetical protein
MRFGPTGTGIIAVHAALGASSSTRVLVPEPGQKVDF